MIKLLSIFKDSTYSFEGQQDGEKTIMLLRRHPFTLSIRLGFFGLACLVPIFIWTIFFSYLKEYLWMDLFLFVSSLWYMGFWLAIFHSITLYTLNTVIITDRRIIDNGQHSFFNREVSELHAYRVQDVTVHTVGVIETMLHFGDIIVQTASSEREFIFRKIGSPEKVKDTIMRIVAAQHSGIKLP